jgi:hypothetical protein
VRSYLIIFAVTFSLSLSFSHLASAADCQQTWQKIHERYEDLGEYRAVDGLCDSDFRSALAQLISTNIDLSYRGARFEMFAHLDNVDGQVCGVYIGRCVKTNKIPNPSIMNCEHSWPQSLGAVGIAKDDLHHLFPVDSKVNSRRSNFPFCIVANVRWSDGGSKYGTDEDGDRCFEPRVEHRGELSRAMLYFALRYDKEIDQKQEELFRRWNNKYAVDEVEERRNEQIDELQHNRNPFVDIPEFVDLISDF